MRVEFGDILKIYKFPSQSLWRALELAKLRELKEELGFEGPVLEIGCGDGCFSALLFNSIDDGIDINPRTIERCRKKSHVYKRMHCMDARAMVFPDNAYETVFANCVLEHIPDLDKVLLGGYRVLRPGGIFVATVPLREMNNHLLFRASWYVELRRKQLQHVNLLSLEEWVEIFRRAGFDRVTLYPYLWGRLCHYWDLFDSPICIGFKRYTISNVLSLIGHIIPSFTKQSYLRGIGRYLANLALVPEDFPCAVLVIAQKG